MRIEELLRAGHSLKEFSTFGIGGPIRFYLEATQIAQIEEAIEWASGQKIPYFILGKGSNCLFDDQGFAGLVIHNKIDFCDFDGCRVYVGAGYSFSLLGTQTAKRGLSGLEFASGIPGSVGGAVYMNAGANGQETCQALEEILYLDPSFGKKIIAREQLTFGHRTSSFQSMRGVILSARFILRQNPDARKIQLDYINRRLMSQPYSEKSAGCVFRNPSMGLSAGLLIDQCGLKGLRCGGAEVSKIHANFIVNVSQATSADVITLIDQVQRQVYEKTKVWLEPEVRLVAMNEE
jgi:UDP-N-acetylmuramate dehydrogenase